MELFKEQEAVRLLTTYASTIRPMFTNPFRFYLSAVSKPSMSRGKHNSAAEFLDFDQSDRTNQSNETKMQRVKESRSHRKRNAYPKPRIIDLDPEAAKRRRLQSRNAQRAFRQRKEVAIESLSTQVNELRNTVKQLSACFLELIDKTMSSKCIIEDPDMLSNIKESIQHFATIANTRQTSDAYFEETHADQRSNTHTKPLESTKCSMLVPPQVPDLTEAEGLESPKAQYTDLQMPDALRRPARLLSGSHRIALEHCAPQWLSSRTPTAFGPDTFAKMLHTAAIHGAYKVACETDHHSQEFQRVFKIHRLFRTRGDLIKGLGRVLQNNPGGLLELPPLSMEVERDPELYSASEATAYYRKNGLDLEASLQSFRQLHKDNGINDARPNSSASIPVACNREGLMVDVKLLIQELLAGGQCSGKHPSFSRLTLDKALRTAVIMN